MAIYLKQNGDWQQIETPYIKREGQWIVPEEGYIKENGQWKLIFDRFDFEVDTISHQESQNGAVLKGQLSSFEDFNEAPHLVEELLNLSGTTATANSKKYNFLIAGDITGNAYVYNESLELLNVLAEPKTNTPITSASVRSDNGDIAISSGSGPVFIYDKTFSLKMKIEKGGLIAGDIEYGPDNRLAIGSRDQKVYVYDKDYNLISPEISFGAKVKSVSWRESDGFLAVGGNKPEVAIYNESLASETSISKDHTGSTFVDFGSKNGQLAVLDEEKIYIYNSSFTRSDTLDEGEGGPKGDISWDDSGKLAHASQDSTVYIYSSSKNLIATFENAEKSYVTADWGKTELLNTGTLNQADGSAYVYSIAVEPFFEFGNEGQNLDVDAVKKRTGGLITTGTYEKTINNLQPNTDYEFRAGAVSRNERTALGQILSFRTPEMSVSTIEPAEDDIELTEASLSGEVAQFNTFESTGNLPRVFIQYGKTQGNSPSNFPQEKLAGATDAQFSETIKQLDSQTRYQFRSKAKFGGVTVFGDRKTFETSLQVSLTTREATPTSTSAELTGEVTQIEGTSEIPVFFEYKTIEEESFTNRVPTNNANDPTVERRNLPVTVTEEVTGLAEDTIFQFRFATTAGGGVNGATERFITGPSFVGGSDTEIEVSSPLPVGSSNSETAEVRIKNEGGTAGTPNITPIDGANTTVQIVSDITSDIQPGQEKTVEIDIQGDSESTQETVGISFNINEDPNSPTAAITREIVIAAESFEKGSDVSFSFTDPLPTGSPEERGVNIKNVGVSAGTPNIRLIDSPNIDLSLASGPGEISPGSVGTVTVEAEATGQSVDQEVGIEFDVSEDPNSPNKSITETIDTTGPELSANPFSGNLSETSDTSVSNETALVGESISFEGNETVEISLLATVETSGTNDGTSAAANLELRTLDADGNPIPNLDLGTSTSEISTDNTNSNIEDQLLTTEISVPQGTEKIGVKRSVNAIDDSFDGNDTANAVIKDTPKPQVKEV